jgi:hypothetical protein
MSATVGRLFHRRRWVTGLRIDHEIRAKARGVRKLAVIDVDRTDLQSHDLGILNARCPRRPAPDMTIYSRGLASVSLIPL